MKPGKVIGYIFLGILFFLGIVGVYQRLLLGHELAGYGSYVVWGLWVSAYIYFIGLSAGAFFLSSLVYVFRVKKLEAMGKPSLLLALVTFFMALFTISFDLGHIERFFYVYLYPNFRSIMTWMIWLYTAYFILLMTALYFAMREDNVRMVKSGKNGWFSFLTLGHNDLSEVSLERDRKTLRILGSIGIPLTIAFNGGVGALFGTVVARSFWHTPLTPILFLSGALLSGGAILLFVSSNFFTEKTTISSLGKIVLGFLLIFILLELAEFSIPMWYGVGPEFQFLKKMLFGEGWWLFWIFHFSLGFLIPLWLLVKYPGSVRALKYAGLLIAVTFFVVRYNIVIPGLITPELKGLESAYQDIRLTFSYIPTLHEFLYICFPVSLGIILWRIGIRTLRVLSLPTLKETDL